MKPALQIRNLQKRYGATVALADMSLECQPGEVHALLGENGAGKSTLVKILSGIVKRDAGEVLIAGDALRIASPASSRAQGIFTAYQEISLVKDLSIAQNFRLGTEPLNMFGMIRKRELEAGVEADLAALGISGINPSRRARDLDLPLRQKIEIARAICSKPRILLLDEPTASLSARDVQWLGDRIEMLRAQGVTILFISHRMPEVREFCSKLTILRNGRDVATFQTGDVSDEEIIRQTIGRSLDTIYPPRPVSMPIADQAEPLLETRSLSTAGQLRDVSLKLHPGRILGVAALEGMGQKELFLSLFGLEQKTAGDILVRGKLVDITAPTDAISAGIGISLVPEDRKTEGLFLSLDGTENATIPQLSRYASYGLVSRRRQADIARTMFAKLNLAERAVWSAAKVFSGGNQQKIVLAKWLMTGARILMLFDPTRGIDVGAKAEIYALMRQFAENGGTILFYSTEIAELVNLADEVIVLYRGRVATHLEDQAISEVAIMGAALGQANYGGGDGRARSVH
ncbi:MAG: transporter related protein [Rhizobium sp.]|nr:transporter related protein [Rhizobium sp.]